MFHCVIRCRSIEPRISGSSPWKTALWIWTAKTMYSRSWREMRSGDDLRTSSFYFTSNTCPGQTSNWCYNEWWWPSHLVILLYTEHLPGSNIQLVLQWVWLVLPPGECYSNGCSGTEFGCVRSTWVIFTGDVAGTIHWHPVQLGDDRCHRKR